MKNKKYPMMIVVLLSLCFISAFSAFAHPGRTDQNGGHWDRKAGTYHFHSGEYAGKGSRGSSASSEYIPFTPPYDPPKINPYRQHKYSKNAEANTFNIPQYCIVMVCIAGIIMCIVLYIHNRKIKEQRRLEQIKTDCLSTIKSLEEYTQQTTNKYKEYEQKFIELCNNVLALDELSELLPPNVSINMHKILHSEPNDIYNVIISRTGRVVHKVYGCSNAFINANICTINIRSKCKKCFSEPIKYIDTDYSRNIFSDLTSVWYKSCVDIIDRVYDARNMNYNFPHRYISWQHDYDWHIKWYQDKQNTIKNDPSLCNYVHEYNRNIEKLKEVKLGYQLISKIWNDAIPPDDLTYFHGVKKFENRVLTFTRECDICHKSAAVMYHFPENDNCTFPISWRCSECSELIEHEKVITHMLFINGSVEESYTEIKLLPPDYKTWLDDGELYVYEYNNDEQVIQTFTTKAAWEKRLYLFYPARIQ